MRTKIKMFCNLPALLRAHVYKLQPPYLAVNLNSSCPEGLMTGESVYCSKLPLKEESRKSCSMSGGSQRSQQLFPLHSPIGSVSSQLFPLLNIFLFLHLFLVYFLLNNLCSTCLRSSRPTQFLLSSVLEFLNNLWG
jgi:hypothetical protein